MWNTKVDFITWGETGNEDGTPIYGEAVVYSQVRGRLDIVPQMSQERKDNFRTEDLTRKVLLVKPKWNGQALNVTEDMQVKIDGKYHTIIVVNPVGNTKPIFLEITLLEVKNT